MTQIDPGYSGLFRAIGRQSKPWKPALLATAGTVGPRIDATDMSDQQFMNDKTHH